MKKAIYSIFTLFAMLCATSCEENYPATNILPPDPTVTFVQDKINLLYDNSRLQNLEIKAEAGVKWKVNSSAEWLTLSIKNSGIGYEFASGVGNGRVYLLAQEYDGEKGEARKAQITLDGGETSVDVFQYPSGEITTSSDLLTFGKGAQTRKISLAVKDNTKEWTLQPMMADGSIAEWITLSTTKAGITAIGSRDITVSVSANEGDNRQAFIMLEEVELFTVTQTNTDFVALTSITVSDNMEMAMGTTESINTALIPADATDSYVYYSSSDTTVATVNARGFITAVSLGEAIITARASDDTNDQLFDECAVTVISAIPVQSISLPKVEVVLGLGNDETYTAIAEVLPTNATNKTVVWSIDKTDIASIDAVTGEVTPIAVGQAVITATTEDGGKEATQIINVIKRVTAIEISGKTSISLNDSITLSAVVTPEDATCRNVIWTISENDGVVSFNENVDGTMSLTGLKGGTAKVKATSESSPTISAEVTVKVLFVELTAINIEDIVLPIGLTREIKIGYTPDNASYQGVSYSYSSEGIIQIVDGVLSYIDGSNPTVGEVITVTATSEQATPTVTTTFNVTVTEAPKVYAVGDLYPDAENPVGIVFWVDPTDATKGQIMSLSQSPKMAWGSLSVEVGAKSTSDGYENTMKVLNHTSFNATDYPGFDWLKTNFIDTIPGNLNWYIPAFEELKRMFVVVYDYKEAGAEEWIKDRSGKAKPDPVLEKTNLAIYNDAYDSVNTFDKFSAGYWCSTEGTMSGADAGTDCVFFSTGSQGLQSKAKDFSNSGQFRAIAKFGE